ncbi:hypothetical protein A9G29_05470 [Gilliamella sp. Fer2-1]|nr:hypothetical protein A9G29_05470 [Gilliamella apicola]
MKIIGKFIFISCFVITLIGCDNKTKFNRIQAFNEYSSIIEYAPYSKHIKKQTIATYSDDLLKSITTILGDKKISSYHNRNEYGDWATATRILTDDNEENAETKLVNIERKIVRGIEYW